MDIIPAIDLRGGQVVRLLRGDYDQETVYDNQPCNVAQRWQNQGAALIHIVDLDGAREGEMKNADAIRSIVQSVSCATEVGGGLRDMNSIDFLLDEIGVTFAILGSVLLEKPGLVEQASQKHPGRIILGMDAKGGKVSTRGWREDSSVNAIDLLQEFRSLPIASVIYTDIARDGTLEGPHIDAMIEMAKASPFPLIASGGIGHLSHIDQLAQAADELPDGSIRGVIVGKALYENKFTLSEAILLTKK